MVKGKVIFIDSVHTILQTELEADGWQCDWKTDCSLDEIKAVISEYTGMVIRSKFRVDREILDLATQLKFIARSGSGLENIDMDYAQSKGIQVFNSPEGNRDAVGEQALGMLLSLFQKLNQADQSVRNGIWDREGHRGIELKGKTVGIIGYGQMGSAFAQRLQGFECNVLAFDKYASGENDFGVTPVSLSTLQEQSDVISFHVPLTTETHYYFDTRFLQNCKRPIYLINTSRGKVVQTEAVAQGLSNGKVLGACLDVLEYESSAFEDVFKGTPPQAFQELIRSDQVVLSPHVAGWTVESYKKLSLFLLEKIRKAF